MRADVCLLRGNSPCVRSPSALPTARSQPNQPGFPAPVARWRPCSSFPPPFPPHPELLSACREEALACNKQILGGDFFSGNFVVRVMRVDMVNMGSMVGFVVEVRMRVW